MAGEQRPRHTPELLEALIGVAADAPVYVYDRELRAIDVFWGGEPLCWGIDPEAPLGRRISEIVAPADAEPFERALREVFETGELRRFEALFHLPVGEVWFEVRLAPLRRAGGDFRYVVSVSRDVTEQRAVHGALLRSRRRFEAFAASVPVGIARTDAEGKVVYRNELCQRLNGVNDSELAEVGWMQGVHPDDRARVLALRTAAYRSRSSFEQEFRMLGPDGSSKWIFSSSVPTEDHEGNFTGFLTSISDITERKQLHEALRESEHRFRSLAEAMPIGVWRSNLESRIVYANRRNWELLGVDPDDLPKGDLWTLLHGMAAARIIDVAESQRLWEESLGALSDRITNPSTFRVRLDDGSERYLRTLAVPEFDSEANFVGHVGVTIDVTDITRARAELTRHRDRLGELVAERTVELERTHEALRRSERLAAIGTFAAGIAHQINNPVGAMLLAAQFALDAPEDRRRVEAALHDIVSEARRCGRTVRGILEFARGPTGEPRPCDLNRIARDCAGKFEAEGAARGAALRLELDARIPHALGNEDALEQVLLNLVYNSVESGAAEIAVATRASDEGVELVVRDDGSGIADEDLDRVFDPLFSKRATGGGTGLGLPLARGIVEASGGSIEVRSRESHGTLVTVRLRPAGPPAEVSGPRQA